MQRSTYPGCQCFFFFGQERKSEEKLFLTSPKKKKLLAPRLKVHSTLKWNRLVPSCRISNVETLPRRHLKVHVSVAMEEDYVIFHGSGEGERRVERQVKKMQETAERPVQMFRVSHTADYCSWADVFQATGIPTDRMPVTSNWKVVKIVDVRVPASSAFQVLP